MVDKVNVLSSSDKKLEHDQEQAYLNLILHQQLASISLEACWMEGYYYGKQGADESLNPFKANTSEHQYYSEGWWAGFYNEEALFPDYAFEGVYNEAVNDAGVKELGLKAKEAVASKGVSVKVLKNGGVLAGLAVAASIIGVLGVTMLDAA